MVRWPLEPLQPFQKTQLQPPVGPSVDSLCHPWFTTTNLSYRFPIFETSATALCGTTGINYYIMVYFIISLKVDGTIDSYNRSSTDGTIDVKIDVLCLLFRLENVTSKRSYVLEVWDTCHIHTLRTGIFHGVWQCKGHLWAWVQPMAD